MVGIPRGGLVFAKALQKHVTAWSHALLVADDVYTTGASMTLALDAYAAQGRHARGVVVFDRSGGALPQNVLALFTLTR